MEEQLITFETAKLAKEKGYDIPDLLNYDLEGKLASTSESTQSYTRDNYYLPLRRRERGLGYLAPTQTLLQKWLREIHGIHIVIIPTVTASWTYKTVNVISKRDDDVIIGLKSVDEVPPYKEVCGYDFNTYEDALEEALQESLNLIKL